VIVVCLCVSVSHTHTYIYIYIHSVSPACLLISVCMQVSLAAEALHALLQHQHGARVLRLLGRVAAAAVADHVTGALEEGEEPSWATMLATALGACVPPHMHAGAPT
jgi:hypothetical protein